MSLQTTLLATVAVSGIVISAAIYGFASGERREVGRCIAEKTHMIAVRQQQDLEASNAALAGDLLAREREIALRNEQLAASDSALAVAMAEAEQLRTAANAKPNANDPVFRADDPWFGGVRDQPAGARPAAAAPGRGGR